MQKFHSLALLQALRGPLLRQDLQSPYYYVKRLIVQLVRMREAASESAHVVGAGVSAGWTEASVVDYSDAVQLLLSFLLLVLRIAFDPRLGTWQQHYSGAGAGVEDAYVQESAGVASSGVCH